MIFPNGQPVTYSMLKQVVTINHYCNNSSKKLFKKLVFVQKIERKQVFQNVRKIYS